MRVDCVRSRTLLSSLLFPGCTEAAPGPPLRARRLPRRQGEHGEKQGLALHLSRSPRGCCGRELQGESSPLPLTEGDRGQPRSRSAGMDPARDGGCNSPAGSTCVMMSSCGVGKRRCAAGSCRRSRLDISGTCGGVPGS
ncbi:unnamed protein product [Eretmochelys imbricata]